jgi:DNA replication and repair protein RecF
MSIRRLRIEEFRNLRSTELDPGRLNVLAGANGSGKTSVLEAVYFLGSGRSFRATRLDPVINREAGKCVVHALLGAETAHAAVSIGVSRDREGCFEGRLQGRSVQNTAELARALPVQLINAETFDLLGGGPRGRRQFLDWGVFHVEQRFHAAWLEVQRALRQRNALLRHARIARAQMDAWDTRLAEAAEVVDGLRRQYFERFQPIFVQTLSDLAPMQGLNLGYYRGWEKDRPLLGVLREHEERDQQRGYTLVGPHRADVRVRLDGLEADQVLSRGQQKVVVCAMKIAQGRLFAQARAQECVFLVDDLPAELDRRHRKALCRSLASMPCQVIVSCVDAAELEGCWDEGAERDLSVFHVEHGRVAKVRH